MKEAARGSKEVKGKLMYLKAVERQRKLIWILYR
jgi:hypothetical protein